MNILFTSVLLFQVDVLISSGQLNVDKEEKVFQVKTRRKFSY